MRTKVSLCVGALWLMQAAPALAQTQSDAQPADAPPATEATSSSGLGELVVTARRREERLQDVPLSVSAMSADTLESSGITEARQLTYIVPGFNGARNFGVFQPAIRGVSSSSVAIGDESNIALYVDGVYQPSILGNITDFVEIERVEVLRGPQGTLFGRNATGGLVNIITPDPSSEFRGRVSLQGDTFNDTAEGQIRTYVSGPLLHNLDADFGLIYRHNGGYIDDLVRGGEYGDSEAVNARSKILFQPTEDFRAVLTLGYLDQSGNVGNSIGPLNGNTIGNSVPGTILAGPYETALTLAPSARLRTFNASLRASWDLGAVSLESTTAFMRDSSHQRSDTDASPLLAAENDTLYRTKAWSEEVRLMSTGSDRLTWLVGLYAFHLDGAGESLVESGAAPTFTTITRFNQGNFAETKSYSAFGEGTYRFTDALRLTLGARYTTEDRSIAPFRNFVPTVPERTHSEDRWTYRASLQYFFAEDANIYLTYSTGFKSGVFNGVLANPVAIDPELLDAVEIGVKADPTNWLRTNLSVFDYSYDGLQVVARDPITNTYILQNAAEARIYGAEFEAQIAATDTLSFRIGLSYLHARYDSFTNAQVFVPNIPVGETLARGNITTAQDVSGNTMLKAPDFTISLGAQWRPQLWGRQFELNANVFHSDTVYYDFGNRVSQPSYTTLSGDIAWLSQDEDWRLRLYGRNLTDELIIQQATATAFTDQVTFERGREIGVMLEYEF